MKLKKELITLRDPKSPVSEIFRTLRTNIQFMNSKNGLKVLHVTSTSPSEGKSWVTSNLAVTFAQAGKKVVLIDCDMRKGRQFSIFGAKPTPGLSNLLTGVDSNGQELDNNIFQYIQQTVIENLYLISSGNVPPNPSELLTSEQMNILVESLKNSFDLIILDGTPCNLVTDSIVLTRYADSTLIVAAYKQTKMEDLKRVKRDIENVGGKIAGVVMNKMPISNKEYYTKYYTKYYYGDSNMPSVKRKHKAMKGTDSDYRKEDLM